MTRQQIHALSRERLLAALELIDQHFWPPRPTRQRKATLAAAICKAIAAGRYRAALERLTR